MLMLPLLLVLALVINLIPSLSFAAVSRTQAFKLTVTLPESANLLPDSPNQTVQTQTAVRNHKTIMLKSIVVP